jgi:pyruvate,water dikinase
LVLDNGQAVDEPQADIMRGIGCSPGVVEGRARVLREPADAEQLQPGEILVAPHTDPGWTPLFLTSRAVVTEIGGFLSHGATVAREYGVPAVFNVTGATHQIQTGDTLRVDGVRGTVSIIATMR